MPARAPPNSPLASVPVFVSLSKSLGVILRHIPPAKHLNRLRFAIRTGLLFPIFAQHCRPPSPALWGDESFRCRCQGGGWRCARHRPWDRFFSRRCRWRFDNFLQHLRCVSGGVLSPGLHDLWLIFRVANEGHAIKRGFDHTFDRPGRRCDGAPSCDNPGTLKSNRQLV